MILISNDQGRFPVTLSATTRKSGIATIVDCCGQIILGDETASLRQLVYELVKKSPNIVLNLTGVTRIDSNGIGTLFGLKISASKSGAVIKLAGLGDRIKSVMEITKLLTFFETFPTAEEAAVSFGPTSEPARVASTS